MTRKRLFVVIGFVCLMLVGIASWAQDISEKKALDLYDEYTIAFPPPVEPLNPAPLISEMDRPVLQSPTGAILVRTMPSSFDPITGYPKPYAWPTRNFPIWGNVAGGVAPYTYVWNFGDGSPSVSGAAANPNYIYAYHSYSIVGIYYAQLTVTDGDGDTNSSAVRIDVAFVDQEVRKNAAIEDGLRYLYLHQAANGAWQESYYGASTATAVAAFEIHGHFPMNDPTQDIFAERVQLGLNYLFSALVTQSIGVQTHGNPDTNGNGIGIRPSGSYTTYIHGLMMLAIASSRDTNSITTTGPAGVIGKKYRDILVDMADQLAYSQVETGGRGGWRYDMNNADYGSSDNSIVQWASIGLKAAEASPWLIHAPQFVKDELLLWMSSSQCADGGFGYTSCSAYGSNVGRTGSGIYSLYYLGVDKSDPRVTAAINYLCSRWFAGGYGATAGSGQFQSNFYAMYAVKKALEDYMIPTVCSPSRSWRDDYEKHLIKDLTSPSPYNGNHQTTDTPNATNDGVWPYSYIYGGNNYGNTISTGFALLVLLPGVRPCAPVPQMTINPPEACPNTEICFDASGSHLDGACTNEEIEQWLWDLDGDGTYERSGQFVCKPEGYPLPNGETQHDYEVKLMVIAGEADSNVTSGTVHIGSEDHLPIAVCGGPYTACVGEPIYLNGCLSYDPDSACLDDGIVEYSWDFEPDGVWDLITTECIPDTSLIYNTEVYKYIQLRVRDKFGLVSASNGGLVEVWSSRKELSVTANDIVFNNVEGCPSVEICATIHAATQDPSISVESAVVDFYYDDPSDPAKRIGRFNTPVMQDGGTVAFCVNWEPPIEGDSIYVVVDPNQLIRECVETDNMAVRVWNCPPDTCVVQPNLSLIGYRTVDYAAPLWKVQVEIRNAGPGKVQNVNVVMNEEIDWLTIPDPNCGYSEILEGGLSWGDDTYTFDLTNHPGGSFNVWFDVTYEDSCRNQYHVRLDPEFDPTNTAQTAPALSFRLAQNYPNPFNPNTTISYQIPVRSMVNLSVFDVSGRLIRTLVNEYNEPGLYAAPWDGKDSRGVSVASGIYFSKLQAGNYKETKRMVLLR
ncbi:MAG: PKD domain-containing protein [Candidatus Krumholzibacteria bacterium]|nr:PKD domain-containing protein [Candidatus Krumholzibacteria bacterium]